MANTTNPNASGSYNFTITRDQMLRHALIDAGVVDVGYVFDQDTLDFCSDKLNMMLKAWQNDGLQVWRLRKFTLFVTNSQGKYQLGPSGDHAAENWDRSTDSTEIATAITATSATTVTVDGTDNMSVGDYVGIELDDGTMQWTTVATIPGTTQFTVADALTDTVALNNKVYYYTTRLPYNPLSILDDANLYVEANATETPLNKIPLEEYRKLGSKTSEGSVNQWAYDRQITHGELYIYPEHTQVRDTIEFRAQLPFDDMDSSSDEFQFDSSWLLAINFGLAEILGVAYGTDLETWKKISAIAQREKDRAMGFDNDVGDGEVSFTPGSRYGSDEF